MTEDKRAHERCPASVPVVYANLTSANAIPYSYQKASAFDISHTGFGLVLTENVRKDDMIQAVVLLPESPHVVTGLAQAIWSLQAGEKNQYRAGFRFLQPIQELGEALKLFEGNEPEPNQ